MDKKIQKELYFDVLRIRRIEEKIQSLYGEKEMRCPTHLCIGQEAVSAGLGRAMQKSDHLFGTYRSHGIYLSKGGDTKKMFAEIYGKKTGVCGGRSGSMQLIDPSVGFICSSAIVGGTLPIAVGSALSAKMQKKNDVSCVLFGDGGTEEGVFHESLNFAALKKLPIVFVCENNFYAVYTPIAKRQAQVDNIYKKAEPYGIPSRCLDGNNIEEVYLEISKAIEFARAGMGPTLLEFRTYRWLEHVGPNTDVHLGYRSQKEYDEWKSKDPLAAYQNKMLKEKVLTESEMNAMELKISTEIQEAVKFAKESEYPDVSDIPKFVYQETQ